MKRIKLDKQTIEPLLILGLVSSENDIKMAWIINKVLNLSLSRMENTGFAEKICNQECSVFQDFQNNLLYSLVTNRPVKSRPFEELKNFDFLFVVSGDGDKHTLNQIKTFIKKENSIAACFEVPFKDIKRKELFEYF